MNNVQQWNTPTQVSFRPKIRLDAIASLPLKETFKQTLFVLDSFVNSKTGACYPGVRAIARRRGRTTRTIQSHLKKLERLGLIKRLARFAEGGRQTSNLFEPTFLQLAHPHVGGVSDTGQRQTRKASPSPPSFLHPSNQILETEPKPKKEHPINAQIPRIDGDRSLYRELLQGFFNTPRQERGLVFNDYSYQANKGSHIHQQICNTMKWAWKEEP